MVVNGTYPVGKIRFPTMVVSMTALLNMSQLTGIEHLLQDIDSLEGHHLHGVLEQQLGQYCHLENFKFKDSNGIVRSFRVRRQISLIALAIVFLASSTAPVDTVARIVARP